MEDSNKCMTEKDSSHGGLCAPVNIMKPEQLQETNATSCTSIRKDEPREVKHRSEFVEVSAVAVAADDLVATSVRNGTTGLSVKSEGNGADCRVASTVDVDLKYGSAVHTALNYEPSHLLSAQKGPDSITAEEDAIWTPLSNDVLSGRGASVNANEGNKNFRAICFSYKALFDAGNHAAKNRIATEVWESCVSKYHSRFLKRRQEKGPWYEQSSHKAILKAAQVMRDYQRSDRQDRKRSRTTSTPIEDATVPMLPVGPIVENPSGTHEHDVLCGRGALVNGHIGNQRLRELGLAHKSDFDAGSFTDKRSLATQIVSIIRGLDPPGRFLRHAKTLIFEERNASEWEELDLESSIIKACQVMRDISRLDRKDRDERRMLRKQCAKIECQVAERAQRADTDIVDLNDYQVDCASEYGLDESDVVETAN